jgi:hypothetical protein
VADAFERMRAAVLGSELAVDATWLPGGQEPGAAVRALLTRPDERVSLGLTPVIVGTALIEVSTADVPSPVAGDELLIEGVRWVVQGAPIRDERQLFWRLDAAPR